MTGSLNSSCVTGHTRSGGLSSNASEAVFAAEASDKVGGESGSRVPEGEEHKPLLRIADILVIVFGLPIGDRSHCQRLEGPMPHLSSIASCLLTRSMHLNAKGSSKIDFGHVDELHMIHECPVLVQLGNISCSVSYEY